MVNIKYYLVSYDQCLHRAVSNLTKEEKDKVYCYAVNSTKFKNITARVKIVNEWQLPWHDNRYQFLQYYEYGFFPHMVKNPPLFEGLTHIGMLHNDVLFHENSVNDMISKLGKNPNQIFYIILRKNDVLYFDKKQLKSIAEYMEPKLNIKIDVDKVWNDGWISESMVAAPLEIFTRFGEFMLKYQFDFENILSTNRWGLMDKVKHRNCGFTERLWGIYLVSCGMPIEKMNVDHDRDNYEHAHLADKQKFLNNM
jgi:hypothetical protein